MTVSDARLRFQRIAAGDMKCFKSSFAQHEQSFTGISGRRAYLTFKALAEGI